MKRIEIANASAALLAVALACAAMGLDQVSEEKVATASASQETLRFADTPDGQPALLDARNHPVPLKHYRRIVGGSIVARSVLGELCEKERIVGVISAGIDDAPDAHRYSGVQQLLGMNETERILALKPDLVILNSLSSISHLQRLRKAGVEIFTLGNMKGVDTFLRDVRQIAALIDHRVQGDRLATGYGRRMRGVADDIPQAKRKRGIYLSAYGTQMFGGTTGTSYHDVLQYAGLIDAAEGRFEGWPQYTAEHILVMDPEVIVSPLGVAKMICERGGLASLQACSDGRAGFVELPSSWLEDPSMVMLDVAESIRESVYGTP